MISIDDNYIYLAMKDRRKRKSDIDAKLVYGLSCGACNNVILAAFELPKGIKKIELWDYEETSIMKTQGIHDIGTFNYYFPTAQNEKPDSCYESTVIENGEDRVQVIRLKNHLMSIENAEKVFTYKMEVGERPCLNVAVASLRKDIAIKSALMLTSIKTNEIYRFDWKNKSEEIFDSVKNPYCAAYKEIQAKGMIPIYGILIPKGKYLAGYLYFPEKHNFYQKY
jgi:hypothetical protein